MGKKKVIVTELVDNIAEVWCEKDGHQFGKHKVYGGGFSNGENTIESVEELSGLNGHVSFELQLDGSPGTVLTDHLYEGKGMSDQRGLNSEIINFYRS